MQHREVPQQQQQQQQELALAALERLRRSPDGAGAWGEAEEALSALCSAEGSGHLRAQLTALFFWARIGWAGTFSKRRRPPTQDEQPTMDDLAANPNLSAPEEVVRASSSSPTSPRPPPLCRFTR